MNVPCQNAEIPSSPSELRMISSSEAPTSAPKAVPCPAGQIGAADHRRGDHLQLHAGAEIGRHRPQPATSTTPQMPADSAEIM